MYRLSLCFDFIFRWYATVEAGGKQLISRWKKNEHSGVVNISEVCMRTGREKQRSRWKEVIGVTMVVEKESDTVGEVAAIHMTPG